MSPRFRIMAVLPVALLVAALALPALGPGSGDALGAGYRAVG